MSRSALRGEGQVATITLNRPDKLNAFTADMIQAWAGALAEAQADDGVNVVIVTGAGRAFCSGGDVGRMRQGEPSALDGKNSLWDGVHRVPKQLEAMDKPVIAMVNGLAVGAGMGMCVMCDMRVAAESARFSTGYVKVGLVPGDGDTYFFPGWSARPRPSSCCGRRTSSRPRKPTGWGSSSAWCPTTSSATRPTRWPGRSPMARRFPFA